VNKYDHLADIVSNSQQPCIGHPSDFELASQPFVVEDEADTQSAARAFFGGGGGREPLTNAKVTTPK